MSLDDIDSELQRLRKASERVGSNLLELELDVLPHLLRDMPLEGESAAAWARTRDSLLQLWHQHGLLDEHLSRALKLRGTRARLRADQLAGLEQLLFEPSLELTKDRVPLEERDLLGSTEVVVRCTPAELLARMSGSFDEVKTVLARFSAAFDGVASTLHAAVSAADELAGAQPAGGRSDPELDRIRHRLGGLAGLLQRDPLSVRPEEVEGVETWLVNARAELEAGQAFRASLPDRLDDARRLLDDLERAEAERASAHRDAVVKITAPCSIPVAGNAELAVSLRQIAETVDAGDWRVAHEALERWTASALSLLEAARRSRSENAALLERRDQLRGRLDAYRAKAHAVGVVEDPQLRLLVDRARDRLYTAPVDLQQAEDDLTRLQQALVATPRREVRCR